MVSAADISFASKGIEDLQLQHQVDVDPLTGSAEVNVSIPLTAGRSGFGPALALQYGSSGGNSSFGVGWSLSGLSSIGLNVKKHLPRYDGQEGFTFNGQNELLPWLEQDGSDWNPRIDESTEYWVRYYRSKYEQNYLRFEQWTQKETGRIHWLTRDGDNTVSVFGLAESNHSRIYDLEDHKRVYLWLLEAQYDRNGNAIVYEYAPEDAAGINILHIYERQRVLQNNFYAQRYLKRIRYANTQPLQMDDAIPDNNQWLFEVVLDYGEHGEDPVSSYSPDRQWSIREDPFSTYRVGFEVRTYRLCQRILMFHHFSELGEGPTLVSCTNLDYQPDPAGTTLLSIGYTGYRRNRQTNEYTFKSIPSLRFSYTSPSVESNFHPVPEQSMENMPNGLSDIRYRWIDLYGDGLPGILTETNQAWYYKPNFGNGEFGPQQKVVDKPSNRVGNYSLSDFDSDGNLNLVVFEGRQAGYCEFDRDHNEWRGFTPFASAPQVDTVTAEAQWLDINGDGCADIVIAKQDRFTWYPSNRREGFDAPIDIAKPQTSGAVQTLTEDRDLQLLFADMNGDGLLDQVRIQNGRVKYWPQLGNGKFGECIVMEDAPVFDYDSEFDPARLRLVDLEGSGTSDLVYISRGEIRYWINASGNRFVEGGRLADLPYIDDISSVQILDFLGDGAPCLVWSSPLVNHTEAPIQYLRLTSGIIPRLLLTVNNSMGQEICLTYSTSAQHYIRDKRAGHEWITKLPSHINVVDKKEVNDLIGHSSLVTRYEYHHGYFDSGEREFRGFGLVDQYDAEFATGAEALPDTYYSPPACVRTWFHHGAFAWNEQISEDYYQGDAQQPQLPIPTFEALLDYRGKTFEDGFRVLAGQMLRQETYATDSNGVRAEHPYQVNQNTYRIRQLQPGNDKRDGCFTFYPSEALTAIYEQQADDPRINHNVTLDIDDYGNVLETCAIAYPRRSGSEDVLLAQQRFNINTSIVDPADMINIDEPQRYELGTSIQSRAYEVYQPETSDNILIQFGQLKTDLHIAVDLPLEFHESFSETEAMLQARLVDWTRNYYWNDTQSDVLPFGGVGLQTLAHHSETASFTDNLISEALGDRITPAQIETEGLYRLQDDYWWQASPTQHYRMRDEFYLPESEQNLDGGIIRYTYDAPYFLTLTGVVDPLNNHTTVEQLDYHLIAPASIRDINDNVSEVLYDPLGMVVVSTVQGNVLNRGGILQLQGTDLLSEYTFDTSPDYLSVIIDPARFLQHTGQYLYYDLESWLIDEQPLRTVSLGREQYVHDGMGGGYPDSRIQTVVSYSDGFGRELQTKQRVEPGSAITRDSSGRVLIDSDGVPIQEEVEERWLVSGHTVYNNKQQPVRQYEPFFSPGVAFESDEELQTYGVATYSQYDALGRLTRQVFPNLTFIKTEFTPWESYNHDPNDTVDESEYRVLREELSSGNQERIALDKALAHANTPTIIQFDSLAREIAQVETSNEEADRVTATELDYQDNPLSITDPRGLTAFRYVRDMAGRVLSEHSMDAGDRFSFYNAIGQAIYQWDGRDVQLRYTYDLLSRPLSVFVDDGSELNHIVERMVYGEDSTVTNAQQKNALGKLVSHYDQAGIVTVEQYDLTGNPVRSVRSLLPYEDDATEPDWTSLSEIDLTTVSRLTTEARYDALGRITEQSLPDNTIRRFDYLPSGGVQQVRISTVDGRLHDMPFISDIAVNARGQRTDAVLGNDVEIGYVYAPDTFRLQTLTARRPRINDTPERTYQNIEYTYDPVGNITHHVDLAQQSGRPSDVLQGLGVNSACEFTYDAFYQLTHAGGRVHQALQRNDYANAFKGTQHIRLNNAAAVVRYQRDYTYDPAGNLSNINHHCTDGTGWDMSKWVSEHSNRSLPAEDMSGIPLTNYENYFDPNGNCTYLPHVSSMQWNYRNNIARVVMIDRSAQGRPDDDETYIYAGDGMRIRKITRRVINGSDDIELSEKIYLDGYEIKRIYFNSELRLERTTSHITDGNNRIALLHQWSRDDLETETEDISQYRIHYQLSNHLGSSALEVNETGQVISYEEYFPFGGTAFIAGNAREVSYKDYRYSGKERDDATGLYYYGYRYYAPWIGNWLCPDPVGPEDTLNLYQFVSNNPVNLMDEFGLEGGPRRITRPLPTRGNTTRAERQRIYRQPYRPPAGPPTGTVRTSPIPLPPTIGPMQGPGADPSSRSESTVPMTPVERTEEPAVPQRSATSGSMQGPEGRPTPVSRTELAVTEQAPETAASEDVPASIEQQGELEESQDMPNASSAGASDESVECGQDPILDPFQELPPHTASDTERWSAQVRHARDEAAERRSRESEPLKAFEIPESETPYFPEEAPTLSEDPGIYGESAEAAEGFHGVAGSPLWEIRPQSEEEHQEMVFETAMLGPEMVGGGLAVAGGIRLATRLARRFPRTTSQLRRAVSWLLRDPNPAPSSGVGGVVTGRGASQVGPDDLGIRDWLRGARERRMLRREVVESLDRLRIAQAETLGSESAVTRSRTVVSPLTSEPEVIMSARFTGRTGIRFRGPGPNALAGTDDATLVLHGRTPDRILGAERVNMGEVYGESIGPDELARILVHDLGWRGGTLRLAGCNAGLPSRSGTIFAEQLAVALQREGALTAVAAPRGGVNVMNNLLTVRSIVSRELFEPRIAIWRYFVPPNN